MHRLRVFCGTACIVAIFFPGAWLVTAYALPQTVHLQTHGATQPIVQDSDSTQSNDLEWLIARYYQQEVIPEAGSQPASETEQPPTPPTPEEMRSAAGKLLGGINGAIDRMSARIAHAEGQGENAQRDAFRALHQRLTQVRDQMQSQQEKLNDALSSGKMDEAGDTLQQLENLDKRATQLEDDAQKVPNRPVSGMRGLFTEPGVDEGLDTNLGRTPSGISSGAEAAGGGGSGSGGGGGGSGGGADAGALIGLAGIAALALAFSEDDEETPPLASPFQPVTSAFGQNEAAGTEGSASYAPNMPGD